jgi:proliferating cell nuclear antigen PCNA
MEIVISQQPKAEIFTALFQHMKLFTEQVTLCCDNERVYMQCMDGANVAIVELVLPADWFDRYEHPSSELTRIGFNTTFLHRVLSSRDKGQKIHIVYSPEDADRLMVHLTCEDAAAGDDAATHASTKRTGACFDKHFELPLIDINEETMQIPEIEYMAEMSMKSGHFSEIITQLKMFGDKVDVDCCEERIILASTSHDQGKMFVEIHIDDLAEFSIDEDAKLKLSFSLTYLKNMCAYNKIAEHVVIKFSQSFPLQMMYPLGANAHLMIHLAPMSDMDD